MIKEFPNEIIDKILEDIHIGLTLVGTDGKILWCNKLAMGILGWKFQNSNTSSVLNCHRIALHDKVIQKINNPKLDKEWHRIIKIKGRFIENTYFPIRIPDYITGIMIITKDVTEREMMHEVIKKAAITDTLTGLYNRKFFEQVWSDFATGDKPFGVIMLDVNALKYVNDNYGHEAGDKLLIKASKLISDNVRQMDYVFRFGGDEFLVLLPEVGNDMLEAIEQRIREQNQIPSAEEPISVYLSIGTCSSLETIEVQDIISCADQKMYEDKRRFYADEGKHLKK